MHHVTICRGKKQIELCSLQREILFAYQLEFSPNTSGGDIVFQTESKYEGGSHSSSLFSRHGFVCIGVMLRLRLAETNNVKKMSFRKKVLYQKRRLTYNYKNNVSWLHFKVPSGRLYCIYRHIYRLDLSKNME